MKRFFVFILTLFVFSSLFALEKRAIVPEDLWKMKRVGEGALSPDGKFLAFTVTSYKLADNSGSTQIWLLDTKTKKYYQITEKGDNFNHVWCKDSKNLLFLSTRDDIVKVFKKNIETKDEQKFFEVPVSISSFKISKNGRYLAFYAKLYSGAKTLEESGKLKEEKSKSKVKARIIEDLPYRIWNHWCNDYKSHIFVADLKTGKIKDVSPKAKYVPPVDLGSGFDFSPDEKYLVYVTNLDENLEASTNNDIFLVKLSDFSISKITESKACDNNPVFSPNGKYIAYKAMRRPGFEADQYDLIIYDIKKQKSKNLTLDFDRDIGSIYWSYNSKYIYSNILDNGRVKLYKINKSNGKIKVLYKEHYNVILGNDKKFIYFKQQRANLPYEIFRINLKNNKIEQLTFLNKKILDSLEMNSLEDFYFTSFDGRKVHALILKPPFFDKNKKYPLIYLIHGGPQGAWEDDFHYRWNSELFASRGYFVAMVNFRGSKGYGQDFCDQVSKNWGGGPYKDLMIGLDSILAFYKDNIDPERVGAAGASYGGFMIDWISTQEGSQKFKCLVSHDGVFDQFSEYGTTEELWFPNWEFGGNPYENPELYEKWSPSKYIKNYKKYKTPMLIIHGENDYRVPINQGLQLFTALQVMGVPSKLLYFPDEDHFVTKPQNSILWWNTVLDWIDRYCK